MKTVLYRPVFINPQAYYVFPQLYDIEPRRNNIYKEQAIFAGRIDVYDVNSPDNVEHFENTREIDLNSFASRHIRISQYTDNGAVALGEWNLPSISNSVENIIETTLLKENNNDQTRKPKF